MVMLLACSGQIQIAIMPRGRRSHNVRIAKRARTLTRSIKQIVH
jgi:hypothetical protein